MLYKIADFYIEIECRYKATELNLSKYISPEKHDADFCIKISDEELAAEEKAFKNYYPDQSFSLPYIERLALLRRISEEITSRDAFLMHGAVIEYKGTGYMFTAKSGTGKTTHIEQWKKLFGDDVHIINGDKPFLRIIDGKVIAYGTPWCGKEGYNENSSVKLQKLCFIERGTENKIRKISDIEAMPRLFSQFDVENGSTLEKHLAMIDVLVCSTDIYVLSCNVSTDAALVAYNGMNNEE